MALAEVSTAYFKNPITGRMMEFTHEVIVYEEGRAFGRSGDAMLRETLFKKTKRAFKI